ncbi:MAG: hypothetical protein EXS24_00045 [Pedosphaera sp.]|nr:hypothetical protein [Pedosphaera sp.]
MKTTIALILGAALIFTGTTGCKKPSDGKSETGQADQFTQSFKVETKTFVDNLKRLATAQPGESNQAVLKRFFVENGVAMDPPSDVILDEIGNRVLVRATEPERQKIQALFERIQKGQ